MADLDQAALVSLDGIFELVGEELYRRLQDPELRKELPGTTLMQLFKEYVRLKGEERKHAEQQEVADSQSILEIVTGAGLPAERKRELIRGELARLEETSAQLRELIFDPAEISTEPGATVTRLVS